MLKSLEEAQREASRLNRLQHPCIVEFLGASTRPPSIVLEYAPMGDLGHYLKSEVQRQSKASAMSSKLVIQEFPDSVLGRQLTFQIAYQVTLGENSIIACCTILVCHLLLKIRVHLIPVSLSDYI